MVPVVPGTEAWVPGREGSGSAWVMGKIVGTPRAEWIGHLYKQGSLEISKGPCQLARNKLPVIYSMAGAAG